MLPRAVRAPFDDPDYLFEPWWGGERVFASVEAEPGADAGMNAGADAGTDAGTVRIVDARGRELGAALPELARSGGLAGRFGGHSVVVDGCLVVIGPDGRPDPPALAARLKGETGGIIVFLAFDLVGLDGRSIVAEPLERRRERLERMIQPGGSLLLVPAIAGEGRALHAAAEGQGIGAVVGRHRRSPYLPGVRSRLWRLVRTEVAGGVGAETDGGMELENGRAGSQPNLLPVLGLILRLPLDDDGSS
jgi:ATP-dependent DNA ligase